MAKGRAKTPAHINEILNLIKKLDSTEMLMIAEKAKKYASTRVDNSIKELEAKLDELKKLKESEK